MSLAMTSSRIAFKKTASRVLSVAFQQQRGMATEKQIWNQIQATKNIEKITSSMKMVSAAKLKGDENRLARAIPFNKWTSALCPEPKEMEGAEFDELPQKVLVVPFTSEKGLCGGVNGQISRSVKLLAKKMQAQGKEISIAVIGDKGRGQLRRSMGEQIVRSSTDVVAPATFNLASALATEIIAAGGATDYDAIVLVYNHYVNAVIYKQMYKVLSPFVFEGEENVTLSTYEFDSDKAESMQDLYEFMIATQIYHSFLDAASAEQSSRMTAMENASKNAGEMIDGLTLKYNRVRQARITTELIEIISGAAALDK